MNKIEYVFLNRIIIAIGLLLIVIFGLLSYFGVKTCTHLIFTGQECGSCGITRDMLAFLRFDFTTPINDNSYGLFIFAALQFIYRIFISTLNTAGTSRIIESNDHLFLGFLFRDYKSRVVGIKKVIITDAMITFILSILVFLPFWKIG